MAINAFIAIDNTAAFECLYIMYNVKNSRRQRG